MALSQGWPNALKVKSEQVGDFDGYRVYEIKSGTPIGCTHFIRDAERWAVQGEGALEGYLFGNTPTRDVAFQTLAGLWIMRLAAKDELLIGVPQESTPFVASRTPARNFSQDPLEPVAKELEVATRIRGVMSDPIVWAPDGRRLGDTQASFLLSMAHHRGWNDGCGWIWDNVSGTRRLAEGLVRRGLAVQTSKSLTYMGRTYSVQRWELTEAGRQIAEDLKLVLDTVRRRANQTA